MPTTKYTAAQVAKHSSTKSCWVIHNNKVFDLTNFVEDHPGGSDFILDHAGKDITEVMKDTATHGHSDAAYGILSDFLIGRLVDGEEEYETSASLGEKSEKFIDPNQPMLRQVWEGNFTKKFYLEQVHIPRHTKESPRIFGPWYLEMLTKTPWWMVPLVWLPAGQSYTYSASQMLDFNVWFPLWLIGILVWTAIEYGLHRFLFHLDDLLPDNRVGITLHFLLHGIHHFTPMDKYRLVLPPILFLILATPFWWVAHQVAPNLAMGYAIGGGTLFGYVAYDCMHYYLHHGHVMTDHARNMRTYHMAHHFKNYQLGFGITTKLWDRVLGTLLEVE
jgi:4-hydroxysphinganine ceramide fatty acyl 2-hydroxylase